MNDQPHDDQAQTSTVDMKFSIDMEALKKEFERFRDEFAGVKGKLSGSAAEALDKMSAYLDASKLAAGRASVAEEIDGITAKVKTAGRETATRIEHEVTERPIASLAVAFGIGLLAAQLLRRN
jgi:ElaB/YqjD/DUF883 family membrane-anchored ribosome-binding protein